MKTFKVWWGNENGWGQLVNEEEDYFESESESELRKSLGLPKGVPGESSYHDFDRKKDKLFTINEVKAKRI